MSVKIHSYLPKNIKQPSDLQYLTSRIKSSITSKYSDMPKDYTELKKLKNRDIALRFSQQLLTGKINNKSQFCKQNHISHDTLNRGLLKIGIKTSNKSKKDHKVSKQESSEKVSKKKPKKEEYIGGHPIKDIDDFMEKASKQKMFS